GAAVAELTISPESDSSEQSRAQNASSYRRCVRAVNCPEAIGTVSAIRSVSLELARSFPRRVWSAPCSHFPAPGTSLPRACPLGPLRVGALLQVGSVVWCRL